MSTSEASLILDHDLYLLFGAAVKREWSFALPRKWRFDFAMPQLWLAVEIEGGIWTRGRHTRGKGFLEDCRKYSTAMAEGWTVFRFPCEMVENGEAMAFLKTWKKVRMSSHKSIRAKGESTWKHEAI